MAAIVRRVQRGGGRPEDLCRRRERAAARQPGAAAGARRLRARRAVERRFPPQRDGRADRHGTRPITPITAARPREFVAAAKYGFLYQGQHYVWQKQAARHAGARPAGRDALSSFCRTTTRSPTAPPGCACHALTSPGRFRAMTAYLLLMPGIPMLFQGQEFAASTPFLYFADHRDDLVEPVRKGRARVPRAVPEHRRPGNAAPSGRPGRPGDIPPRHPRSRRARAARAGLRAASRPARAAPRRSGARAAAGAGRRRGDRRARLDAAVFRR